MSLNICPLTEPSRAVLSRTEPGVERGAMYILALAHRAELSPREAVN